MKALNPTLAKTVGEKAAIIFQHICYWMQTQNVDKVYRTNKQLVEDLEGMFSEQQIQRAKKKLLESGMIEVSFDKKNVWNRTTHYSLTEEGKQHVLQMRVVSDSSDVKQKVGNRTTKPSNKPLNSAKAQIEGVSKYNNVKSNIVATNNPSPVASTTAMQDSFNEGFGNKNAVPCPVNLKDLLKAKQQCSNESTAPTQTTVDTEWEAIVKAEMEMLDDVYSDEDYTSNEEEYISDTDYDACDLAMLNTLSQGAVSQQRVEQEPKLSFAELLKQSFKKGVTEAQEKMYSMKSEQYTFKEDY